MYLLNFARSSAQVIVLSIVTARIAVGIPATGVAVVDKSNLGDKFCTAVIYGKFQTFGVSTTITEVDGTSFQILTGRVKGNFEFPGNGAPASAYEPVISALEQAVPVYPRATDTLKLVISEMKRRAIEAAEVKTMAPQPTDGRSITDLNGKTYNNVKISKVEPDGISILHSSGAIKLPFSILSDDLRKEFKYDPEKAASYTVQKQKELAKMNAARMAEAAKREEEEQRRRRMEELRRSATRIHFEITQVLDGGLLIWNLHGGKTEYLRINPDFFDVADGEKYHALVISDGVYEYVSVIGAKNTVRAWKFVPE